MTEIIELLKAIWFVLFLVLLFKDMSGKSELREIKGFGGDEEWLSTSTKSSF